jgi:corrinoid protein of di/trimethylamine methyltransferase
MPSVERKKELLIGLYDAVVNYDEDASAELSRAVVEEGVDAYDAVMNGLVAGMEKVGELFASHEYFVPEMLMCADALYAGLNILRPHIKGEQAEEKGQVVIGTVEGDVHDIGKNLVKLMFEVAGWTVHDLGKDVKLERFVEEQMKTDSDVVALSALMTTSMLGIPKIVEMIKARNPNVAIMIGGAPITEEVANQYGADGYSSSAGNAVQEAINMIGQLRKRHQAKMNEK